MRSASRLSGAAGLWLTAGALAALSVAIVWVATLLRRPPLNVVLITLDTTRADRLSPYGFMNATMPALEGLARDGVVFDQATTVAPLTLPAHTSLFTARFPPAHGVRDNAGDHGESLGDHGERDHGVFVYESVLRVPLIVRAPAISPGRVASVVRLVDVMPTVLDLLDVPAPAADGVSLRPLLTGDVFDLQLEAYAESEYPRRLGWSPVRSLREGRYKAIDAPRPELYDLDRDPFEERNIHAERVSIAAAMTQRLRTLAGTAAGRTDSGKLPREVAEGLAALGYVTGRGSPPRSASGETDGQAVSLPDPKDCIHLMNAPPASRDPSIDAPARLHCR